MQGQEFEIREYAAGDRDEVISLWHRCDLVVPWNDPGRDIDRKLEVGRNLFLVAVTEGRVVASVMGGYEGHRGWINYLAVLPEYRGRGIAKQIMAEVERRIAAMGCAKINLQVRASNTDVVGFYKSIGYGEEDLQNMGKRLVSDE